tara:strand:+ start:12419 stop:13108 length:690 start_codon:yes stop_codon:yes gene_type:complete
MTTYIKTQNLTIGYPKKVVLKDIAIDFHAGEFIGLIGPNASGKSTLAKTLMGTLPKISGTIEKQAGLSQAYVPQKIRVNPQIPLNVAEFLDLKAGPIDLDWKHEVLQMVNLEKQTQASIHTLSGGQLQRLFVAYALLDKPKLIILDEATEGMDLSSLQEVFRHLKKYVEKENACLVYITHDITAVSELCNRALCLHQGVAYDGSPNDPNFHQCLHNIYGEKTTIHDHRH